MSTIAVTAATGHLGTLVVAGLTGRGHQVVAVVRDPAKAARTAALTAADVEVRVADYEDRAALDAALAGVDRVVFISGSEPGQRVPQHTNVVEAARQAGVAQLVYTSAPHADDTTLVLAPEHKVTEGVIRASGVPFTVLRNNWYTEN